MIWGKLDYETLSMTLNNNKKIAWFTILNVKGWPQKLVQYKQLKKLHVLQWTKWFWFCKLLNKHLTHGWKDTMLNSGIRPHDQLWVTFLF